ncbi:hypothetical protein WwAna0372 [Wolbachia endosymbiont of Drosophila ananassae]|nr:hypothetical protein WwAna0372 [Wolbachia endosymbiont of Drosophila ananassae]
MLESNFAISELRRKLANIVRIGIVEKIDYEKAKVKVKIGELVTDFLPWITNRAENWLPPNIDEQVIVLSPLGELSLGVVLPAIYQEKYPPQLSSGSQVIINQLVLSYTALKLVL